MSDTQQKLPIVEIVLFALLVIGATIAWNTRASRAIPVGAKPAAGAQPAPSSGWSAKAAPRPHHRPPLSGEATDRAEQLCVGMVTTQLGWRLKDSVTSAVATDRYGVGDHESGAGDSLIVEGTAQTASGATHRFSCSMSTLSSFYGGPLITFPDLTR